MADFVTRFEAEEGVSRENFNSRIDQMNSGLQSVMDGAVKYYTNLSSLGLDEATAAAGDIVEKMADGSVLLHRLGANATGAVMAFPVNYSLLRVTKSSSSYTSFEVFVTGSAAVYTGYYNGGATTKWSGWNKGYSEKAKPAAADIGAAPASHASTATTYGVGTTANYGHVKVTAGNGLAISSGAISMGAASASAAGAVTTGAQTFAGDKTFSGTVALTKATDLSGTANNGPPLIVGARTGEHIEIDSNEIQAKADGTTTAPLIINLDGGQIQLGKGGTASFGALYMQESKYVYGRAYASNTATELTNSMMIGMSSGTSGSARGTVVVGTKNTNIDIRGADSITCTSMPVETSSMRNIHAGTSAMTAGTTALTTGRIYLQYE